jgi:PAS domain S-box-containing protein
MEMMTDPGTLTAIALGAALMLIAAGAAMLLRKKQGASKLAEARALLMAVSDNTRDPIYIKDLEGRLVFANTAMFRLLGKDSKQALNQALHESIRELFATPEQADILDRDDERVLRERSTTTVEHTLHLPLGARTYVTTKSPWLDSEGRVIGIIGISTDISTRKETEDALRLREARLEEAIARRTAALRRMADHLEMVREEEKRAIARELHDDMGAALTSLSMHLEGTYELFPDEPKWMDRKAKIQALLKSVVKTTRRLQTELRPTMLDLFGIKAAIHELADDFTQNSGIACHPNLPDEDVSIGHKLEIKLYRMLQEVLNNVVKHAQATKVDIILDVDEDRVALTVRDNGVGITPERRDNPSTYGLRGLHERAAFLGGTVHIAAGNKGGTTVSIELPLNTDETRSVSL